MPGRGLTLPSPALPACLCAQVNKQGTDFGCRSGGQRVGDVALPPWASDAADFLYKLQEALESPHVSARLHKWIDLVFGRKSRGGAAERADNVFHFLTYDEVALRWLEGEGDPARREALRLQMMEFGRTPRQVRRAPGVRRRRAGSEAGRLAEWIHAVQRVGGTTELACASDAPHACSTTTPPPAPGAALHPQAPQAKGAGAWRRAGLLQLLHRAAAGAAPAHQPARWQALQCAHHPSRQQVGTPVGGVRQSAGSYRWAQSCHVDGSVPSPPTFNPTLLSSYLAYRAVFKLSCSPKREQREALLHFLEHTAAHGEPDALALRQTRGAELYVLVKAARDARDGRPGAVAPAAEMQASLVRAVAALAACPQNRRYILEAGCLDAVAEAVAATQPELAATAVQVGPLLWVVEGWRVHQSGGRDSDICGWLAQLQKQAAANQGSAAWLVNCPVCLAGAGAAGARGESQGAGAGRAVAGAPAGRAAPAANRRRAAGGAGGGDAPG